ncbi:hypothetical protein [Virgibacillus kimchii]
MKRCLLILFSCCVLVLAACTDSEGQTDEQVDEKMEEETEEVHRSAEQDAADENVTDSTKNDDEGAGGEAKGKTDLTLQLTKVDEENGSTLESDIYQEISQIMEDHPDMGIENDFSVFTVDIYQSDAGRSLVMLGVNRTPIELTNISFDLNLGSQEVFVLENMSIHLSEDEMGTFPVNGVMPFVIDLSAEQAAVLQNIDQEDILLTLDNFEYDEGE